ncbi:MAG: YkgJ family cysteine cluster protein [Gammaproteobacteria bacterium]|nr:YkgJ family cysteine cluster protein [Gammaproteobacteria bacterium]NIU05491.1 YkgJ family cysteine cluster protein [Gammaproteobacteria bacterium]NIV52637.1 YkgJ family cysteine cluster protein [Gammaproteobacteria bacterium]NIX86764.1 YkgJ family cysteine cluster protein [Gammaproteobacteria bacterium]
MSEEDFYGRLKETIGEAPEQSPVQPVELGLDDAIQFHCHKEVACFNLCCMNIDITLTPYDILRLSRRLGLSTSEFLERYTMPFEMDAQGMPGVKLRPRDESPACRFVADEGCGVYEDRPAACRYYALGTMGVRKKDTAEVEDAYFIVREPHCLGHQEPRRLTVREYRREQGCDVYDAKNQAWREVVLKKRSSGPTVGRPSDRSFELFYTASYDLDAFRDFVLSDSFNETFDVDAGTYERLARDDGALLEFAMRFLKQVLYGERTIPFREGARERRIERRRQRMEERHEESRRRDDYDPRYDAPAEGD